MKYPWMPLFWGDFLANTMHLSAQEAGAYLFLIAHAWENGGKIPGNPARLSRIAHVRPEWWKRVWQTLEPYFQREPCVTDMCGYTHVRVTAELHRLAQKSSNISTAATRREHDKSTNAAISHTRSRKTSSLNGSVKPRARPIHGGMSPDVGDDYRSPGRKSENVLQPIPDKSP